MSTTVYDIAAPIVEELTKVDEDGMDIDAKDDDPMKDEKVRNKTLAGAIASILDSVNPVLVKGADPVSQTSRALEVAAKAITSSFSVIQESTFEGLKEFFERLEHADSNPETPDDMSINVSKLLFGWSNDAMAEALRIKKAKAILAFAKIPWKGIVKTVLDEHLRNEIEGEKSTVVRKELESVKYG
ncbi:hypothetical protein M501DRAFT_31973 [Patellaria atrata CBS 101060]|uniref:Uncharacterized protein n=1 Tax=Patellaria atrata CBS 101060 TaxID=1346257 RepID=A0A9P4SID7_9PEZI|nr:hypothetical protein M501DRAFT_31973 [Patellaria atrata CBS 101060]